MWEPHLSNHDAAIRLRHGAAGRARERLLELFEVDEREVDAVFGGQSEAGLERPTAVVVVARFAVVQGVIHEEQLLGAQLRQPGETEVGLPDALDV